MAPPRLQGPFPANPHPVAWAYAGDLNQEDSRTEVRATGSATL